MEGMIMTAIYILGGILVLCLVLNIILAAKKGTSSKWLNRILYLSGIACVILNMVRVWLLYTDNSTYIMIACVVCLVCILISFWRSEHPVQSDESQQQ